MSVVQTSNVGFTSEVSDYLVVHKSQSRQKLISTVLVHVNVIRVRHTIIWTGQDYSTGNSSRRKTKRQTEETMGRQHQRVDWP